MPRLRPTRRRWQPRGTKCIDQGNLSAIQDRAYEYAVTQNHATAIEPVITDMNSRLGPVQVHTTVQTPSFFAPILGRESNTAGATASASCFTPATLGGILPITWTCGLLNGEPADQCHIKSIPWSLFNGPIRFHYEAGLSADGSLILDEGDGTNYQSYADGSGAQMVYDVYDTSIKGWLSLDGSCKTPPCLRDWLGSGGYPGPMTVPVWVPVINGTKKGALNDPPPTFEPVVLVPISNATCPSKAGIPGCAGYQPGDNILPVSSNTDWNRVVGFAPFAVTCVTKQGNDRCPKAGKGQGSIEGYFVGGILQGA